MPAELQSLTIESAGALDVAIRKLAQKHGYTIRGFEDVMYFLSGKDSQGNPWITKNVDNGGKAVASKELVQAWFTEVMARKGQGETLRSVSEGFTISEGESKLSRNRNNPLTMEAKNLKKYGLNDKPVEADVLIAAFNAGVESWGEVLPLLYRSYSAPLGEARARPVSIMGGEAYDVKVQDLIRPLMDELIQAPLFGRISDTKSVEVTKTVTRVSFDTILEAMVKNKGSEVMMVSASPLSDTMAKLYGANNIITMDPTTANTMGTTAKPFSPGSGRDQYVATVETDVGKAIVKNFDKMAAGGSKEGRPLHISLTETQLANQSAVKNIMENLLTLPQYKNSRFIVVDSNGREIVIKPTKGGYASLDKAISSGFEKSRGSKPLDLKELQFSAAPEEGPPVVIVFGPRNFGANFGFSKDSIAIIHGTPRSYYEVIRQAMGRMRGTMENAGDKVDFDSMPTRVLLVTEAKRDSKIVTSKEYSLTYGEYLAQANANQESASKIENTRLAVELAMSPKYRALEKAIISERAKGNDAAVKALEGLRIEALTSDSILMNKFKEARASDFVIRDALDSTAKFMESKMGKGSKVYSMLDPSTQSMLDGLILGGPTEGTSLPYFLAANRVSDITQSILSRNKISDFTPKYPGFENQATVTIGTTAKEGFAKIKAHGENWEGQLVPQTVGQLFNTLGVQGAEAQKLYNDLAVLPGFFQKLAGKLF